MKLDIQFVGVQANTILVRRIHEHLEQLLGSRLTLIESFDLSIGQSPMSADSNAVLGEGVVVLKDGTEIRATTSSAKLMTLIDGCVQKLEEEFHKMARDQRSFAGLDNVSFSSPLSVTNDQISVR